jgi:putative N6-adenine-specific DNA methylase
MTNFDEPQTIRITCAPGLIDYLRHEVEALGYTVDSHRPTGLEITAGMQDAMRLNLFLRTAFNVLFLIDTFTCADPDALYEHVRTLPWEKMIAPDEYLSVISSVNTPTINDWRFASVKIKDAIVDRVASVAGARPNSGPQRENFVVNLYWNGDDARLFLNTSGRKLADRSYRKMPHKAPMQETLAAAVMIATEYDGAVPLVNPMCGSGTLAIEAALIAAGRPPGLLRDNFGFMHRNGFDADTWQSMRRRARKLRNQAAIAPIIATDIDPGAIRAAGKNALTAGVDHMIRFEVCDFADTPMPPEPGIVVINPEYGERLGEIAELEKTYSRMGDFFKQRCPGWTGYIFTGNLELAKKVGLRASRRMAFFNAKIECRLLKYELYEGTRRKESSQTDT